MGKIIGHSSSLYFTPFSPFERKKRKKKSPFQKEATEDDVSALTTRGLWLKERVETGRVVFSVNNRTLTFSFLGPLSSYPKSPLRTIHGHENSLASGAIFSSDFFELDF